MYVWFLLPKYQDFQSIGSQIKVIILYMCVMCEMRRKYHFCLIISKIKHFFHTKCVVQSFLQLCSEHFPSNKLVGWLKRIGNATIKCLQCNILLPLGVCHWMASADWFLLSVIGWTSAYLTSTRLWNHSSQWGSLVFGKRRNFGKKGGCFSFPLPLC